MLPGRFPLTTETVQLRLVVDAESYSVQVRPEGLGRFETAAQGVLPPRAGLEEVALECSGGPAEEEQWFRFQGVRIFRLPD